jgi:hypothetical protein
LTTCRILIATCMQHFCIIPNVLFHIHNLTNPTPMITDRFDRTYMVVVMQLNECHESPVTQSDIGSPHMGEGSTCLHAAGVLLLLFATCNALAAISFQQLTSSQSGLWYEWLVMKTIYHIRSVLQ